MGKKQYMVMGSTHVDLAWKKGREELSEIQEIFIIRLLDALENHATFTYVIEQAAHYRYVALRRPDLIERLKPYVKEGRLEMVGGMASTLDTNIPMGESFVKNQMLGLTWVKDSFDTCIRTGWLIDTFGVNAQVPQILRQFGIRHLMANRFGGRKQHDVFVSRGLDGSEILVAGSDVYSAFVKPGNVVFDFCSDWHQIERLFEKALALEGDGPILISPYTENEVPVSLRTIAYMEKKSSDDPNGDWRFVVPHQFFDALEDSNGKWPVEDGDLNPEFTGTFSLRPHLRIKNRRTETLLLEAEKWASLLNLQGWEKKLEEAWWDMAFNQFHDVISGSHPTKVYKDVMDIYEKVEAAASVILENACKTLVPECQTQADHMTVVVFNGLPWEREDIITLPLPQSLQGVSRVSCQGKMLPFQVRGRELSVLAQVPAVGLNGLIIDSGQSSVYETVEADHGVIENEYIRLECDRLSGIKRLQWKQTGKVLMENAGDLLVVQQDDGNYQIENPAGSEVIASTGDIKVFKHPSSSMGERITISGAFPKLSWAGENNTLSWQAELTLLKGKPRLDIKLTLHWEGEGSRIRLKLTTDLDTARGIYEIPYGTVTRKPYGVTGNAKGEWPALRFTAIEDGEHGIALINTGTAGVEVNGGTVINTLIRAPKTEYAGMIPDDTSSQHGDHVFNFAVAPYSGSWSDADIAALAQEVNNPLHRLLFEGASSDINTLSYIHVDNRNVVLSTVKKPEDGLDELVVRLYETAGRACAATLFVKDAVQAWDSDLTEKKSGALLCMNGLIELRMEAFEIRTLRVVRKA